MSLLSRLLDATIVLSFDRSGFRRHAASFRPEDLRGRPVRPRGRRDRGELRHRQGHEPRPRRSAGLRSFLLCRSEERGRAALHELREATGSRRLRLVTVDVAEPDSIRSAVRSIGAERVHVLVNNAAVLPDERRETSGGVELTFATNVLGPFLLTRLLEPRLRASGSARVVNVSSGGMYARRLITRRLGLRRGGPFDGVVAYAEAKRALVVAHRDVGASGLAGSGVTVNAMHPGWADTPAVRTSLPRFRRTMASRLRTPEEGADTVVWMSVCPRLGSETGRFYFDREPPRDPPPAVDARGPDGPHARFGSSARD